ncbi:hypothetical protein AAG570_005134 [Ranatra chinensis]|uniref:Uncharacterized protein n=1 Tax=Ranatra chinensis TaxID=642074 RepID=A0ABD0XZJ7_9HEMI
MLDAGRRRSREVVEIGLSVSRAATSVPVGFLGQIHRQLVSVYGEGVIGCHWWGIGEEGESSSISEENTDDIQMESESEDDGAEAEVQDDESDDVEYDEDSDDESNEDISSVTKGEIKTSEEGVWDLRTRKQAFSVSPTDEYISSIVSSEEYTAVLGSDGTVVGFDARRLKKLDQSFLNCGCLSSGALFRDESRLIIGGSDGDLVFYKWGEFDYPLEQYSPRKGTGINQIVAARNLVGAVGFEDGLIRYDLQFSIRC